MIVLLPVLLHCVRLRTASPRITVSSLFDSSTRIGLAVLIEPRVVGCLTRQLPVGWGAGSQGVLGLSAGGRPSCQDLQFGQAQECAKLPLVHLVAKGLEMEGEGKGALGLSGSGFLSLQISI